MNNQTFDPRMWVVLMQHYQKTRKKAYLIPLHAASALINSLVVIVVMLFEWELMVSVFEKIVGDQSEFFSPEIMGATSFILVMAIHYLSETNKESLVMRWLDSLVSILAPIYLLGVGVLLAVLLFNHGGISDMLDFADLDVDFEAITSKEKSWLTALMENVASPVASILFSLGIGALAIINVFIAHRAINKVSSNTAQVVQRGEALKADRANIQTYTKEKQAYQNVILEIKRYEEDEKSIKLKIAGEILSVLQAENTENKKKLAAIKTKQDAFNPLPETLPKINIKESEKAVKAIDDITVEDLVKLMN